MVDEQHCCNGCSRNDHCDHARMTKRNSQLERRPRRHYKIRVVERPNNCQPREEVPSGTAVMPWILADYFTSGLASPTKLSRFGIRIALKEAASSSASAPSNPFRLRM